MQPDFWLRRWQNNQIGFHAATANPYLQQYWPGLEVPQGAQVLVPLCGKSLDLVWLAGQGLRVLGIELVEQAVEDFFREHNLQPQIRQHGVFRIYQAGNLELWCGDIFALTAEDLRGCTALYDRAALIALPPAMREAYARHLTQLLPSGCRGLLVNLDYEQSQMDGPPFSVPDVEVQRLLAEWEPQLLHLENGLKAEENWKFLQRGLQRMDEGVYRLQRR
ncbi:MAG: thiopurine S-methyltransferase [Pseudomonas sp.]|uniref:thiopurine S-methyltransferase n=1 Tax=Pseudomonas sp. TaxID=306 RepID=UPI0030F1A130